MKRLGLHTIFWLIYCAQDICIQFIYGKPILAGIPYGRQFTMSAESELIMLPFKLAVTYFALYVFLRRVLDEKRSILPAVVLMLAVTAANVVLARIVYRYYVDPVIFQQTGYHSPLFRVMDIFTVLFDIGPVAVIAIIIKFVRMQLRSRGNERRLMKEKLETELKFLRSQINPHLVFKTLDNIYTLSLVKSVDTPEVIMQLSKLLNFMLYESRKRTISIGEEMNILDDYIELERTLHKSGVEIDFIREIDNDHQQIAPSILLSLVENAFKRGGQGNSGISYVLIDIRLQSAHLYCNIERVNRPDDPMPCDNVGIFHNAKRQIELLYADYHLGTEEKKECFAINLVINLVSLKE